MFILVSLLIYGVFPTAAGSSCTRIAPAAALCYHLIYKNYDI